MEVACREVILEWPRLAELAAFARQRRGYGNSNGGFGVTYPEDLDEFQREVEHIQIPSGSLLVYGYACAQPPGYELLVPERTYLMVLASVLFMAGYASEAAGIQALLTGDTR